MVSWSGRRCRSIRAGTTSAPDRRRARRGPRAPRAGATPATVGVGELTRRHVAAASRTDTGSSNGPAGDGIHATSSSSTKRDATRAGRRHRASRAARRQQASTMRRRARPSTIVKSRRSSSSRSRVRGRSAMIVPSSTARSNIGSGRVRQGKFPSTAPATRTVSNSLPGGSVGGQHADGVERRRAPTGIARDRARRRRALRGTPATLRSPLLARPRLTTFAKRRPPCRGRAGRRPSVAGALDEPGRRTEAPPTAP